MHLARSTTAMKPSSLSMPPERLLQSKMPKMCTRSPLVLQSTDHITTLCTVSAAGFPLPPMIIYPNGFPGGAYTFQGPDDALYGKGESGWVDGELFLSWMKKVFLKFAVPQ